MATYPLPFKSLVWGNISVATKGYRTVGRGWGRSKQLRNATVYQKPQNLDQILPKNTKKNTQILPNKTCNPTNRRSDSHWATRL